MVQCLKCGIGQNESSSFCTVCGNVLQQSSSNVSTEVKKPAVINDWEERNGSIFITLWNTIKTILSTPTIFFQQITPKTKIAPALFFYILVTLFALPATMLYQTIQSSGDTNGFAATQIMLQPLTTLLFGVSGIYIGAALYMLLFMITGVKKASYKETAIALCYTNAPMVLMIIPIPFLPLIVAGIWVFILQIIGLASVHRCSVGKMAAIQIVPLIIISIVFAILIAVIVAFAVVLGFSLTDSLKIQDILDLIR